MSDLQFTNDIENPDVGSLSLPSSETLFHPATMSPDIADAHIQGMTEANGLQNDPEQAENDSKLLQDIVSSGHDPEIASQFQNVPPQPTINPLLKSNPQQTMDLQKLILLAQLQQQTENPEKIRQAQLSQNANDLYTRLAEAGQRIGAGMAQSGGVHIDAPDTKPYQELRAGYQPVQQLESQQSADAKRLQELATTYAKLSAANAKGGIKTTISPILQTQDGRNLYLTPTGDTLTKNEKTGALEPYYGKAVNISNEVAKEGVVARNRMAASREVGNQNQQTGLEHQEQQDFQNGDSYKRYKNTLMADDQISKILQNPEKYNQQDFVAAATAASQIPGFDVDKVKGGTQSLNQIVTNITNQGQGKSAITPEQLTGLQNINNGVHNSVLPYLSDELSATRKRLQGSNLNETHVMGPAILDWQNQYLKAKKQDAQKSSSQNSTQTRYLFNDQTNKTTVIPSDGSAPYEIEGRPPTK